MTTITWKQGVTEKSLELINVDLKQGGQEGAALLHPSGALDRVREALCGPESTNHCLI